MLIFSRSHINHTHVFVFAPKPQKNTMLNGKFRLRVHLVLDFLLKNSHIIFLFRQGSQI
jgi:hypothetical protein